MRRGRRTRSEERGAKALELCLLYCVPELMAPMHEEIAVSCERNVPNPRGGLPEGNATNLAVAIPSDRNGKLSPRKEPQIAPGSP
jgi:hypothetical protein